MKRYIRALACFGAIAFGAGGCAGTYSGADSYEQANVSVGFDYFHDALSPYGSWVERDPYGWVWCPLDIQAGWRPYTVGHWAYTDWGWMWLADDPWGPLPYQYGRWSYDNLYGWVWIPGNVWAPAWVAWHYGDGWVGWAPLPPEATWQVGVGFGTSATSFDDRIDPYSWCFVPARAFSTRRIRSVVVPPSRNETLLSITANVTKYTIVDSRPAERGMSVDLIEREAGHRIQKYQVVDGGAPRGTWKEAVRGNSIQVYRPEIAPQSPANKQMNPAVPERLRSRTPQALIARQEKESRRFEKRMAQERAALQREQDREFRNLPRGIPVAELKRRHDAELLAQQAREKRERDAMQHRREELQKELGKQAARDQKNADQGNDQDQSHGHGRGHSRQD